MTKTVARSPVVRLGLRENFAQFALLVGVNALVGGMLGQERTVMPLIATRVFHLHAYTAALTYIVAFGTVKAVTNFVAGAMSERTGRKPVLVAGWLIGLPVPFLLAFGPGWAWIILANVMLGVNQGIIMVLAVVVIGGLVGSGGLGYEVAYGLQQGQFGAGVVASIAILALGIALDRVTRGNRQARLEGSR